MTSHSKDLSIPGERIGYVAVNPQCNGVMSRSLSLNDYNYPFLKVADVLKKADLTVGNLENPITENCPIINGGFTFCTKKEMMSGLLLAGIDMVSLANNHTNNYGSVGLTQTKNF